ncbi:hypothetical protein L208DRAFT_1265062 [Tricholoma matsutake]|nr:hypothetical protein L208DRAFT_1265062 [Tricholoma matsutake 945]
MSLCYLHLSIKLCLLLWECVGLHCFFSFSFSFFLPYFYFCIAFCYPFSLQTITTKCFFSIFILLFPHALLFVIICLSASCINVLASSPPASFWAISINANDLADPMKISTINSFAHLIKPHAIVIQETQSTEHIASQLDMPGYDFHESPGCPSLACGHGKWGIIIAVKHHLFDVQPLLQLLLTSQYLL